MAGQITQEITELPEAPKEGSGFRVRAADYLGKLVTLANQLAVWRTQANALADAVAADAATCSEAAGGITASVDAAAASAAAAQGSATAAEGAKTVAAEKAELAIAAAGLADEAKTGAVAARDQAAAVAAGLGLPAISAEDAGSALVVGSDGKLTLGQSGLSKADVRRIALRYS